MNITAAAAPPISRMLPPIMAGSGRRERCESRGGRPAELPTDGLGGGEAWGRKSRRKPAVADRSSADGDVDGEKIAGDGALNVTGRPQLVQNRAPGLRSRPQSGHPRLLPAISRRPPHNQTRGPFGPRQDRYPRFLNSGEKMIRSTNSIRLLTLLRVRHVLAERDCAAPADSLLIRLPVLPVAGD